MRFGSELTIRAAATWLPPVRQTADAAVLAGLTTVADAEAAGAAEVPVSCGPSGPEMAVRAARRALSEAQVTPEETDLVIHAWIHHQGHDFWSPAHYVADQLGASDAVAFGIQQMCHAGAMALHTAAVRLEADPSVRNALVTTGDRFAAPAFDRWRGDYDAVFGDGGTAAVVGRSGPGLRILSHALGSAPELESMYRGRDEFTTVPLAHSVPVDARRTKKAFLADGGMARFAEIGPRKVRATLMAALAEAGLKPDDPRIRCATLSRLGPKTIDLLYLPIMQEVIKAEILHLGGRTGHLGGGDAIANLADLWDQELLAPGEFAVGFSGGGGFTWSCLVVQRVTD
ncbi:ketoacyl-ACP synthase III family protein [Streptomyces sp. RY43-2]|uniref:Ketoacyl-ACP synthase III family protein n=1 Tax=Streptomyces macrolidinus TaxID=2952607 RepID=A0ABT0ZMM6_9ACTN|nr:ketoacyl-ACP synthase III family protein [Streptomyces macrolidinus]MCN9244837.1 ketoacyl-ACP synthase III family protein [Streptomyces macrolidinus]